MLKGTLPDRLPGRTTGAAGSLPTAREREIEAGLRRLELVASWMDDRLRLPGGFRVGLDGFLGLVPVVGDSISGLIALYLVLEAWRLGASGGTLGRMLLNIGLDTVVGSIPVLGDAADFAFKSNRRNLSLLRRHLGRAGTVG